MAEGSAENNSFETRAITPETLRVSIITAGVLMVVFLLVSMVFTPDGSQRQRPALIADNKQDVRLRSLDSNTLKSMVKSIVGNRPLCIFVGSYISYGVGMGMWFGFVFLYVDTYLGLGEQFAQVFLCSFVVGMVATPVWCKIANKLGKKMAISLAIVMIIISFIYTGTLRPGIAGLYELLVWLVTNTLGVACFIAIAPAMFSKIIDYSTWKFRSEKTATYFSIYTFLAKANIAIGGAFGLAIAGWYGFDAAASVQTSEAVFGVTLVMTILPIIFMFIALLLTLLNPINARRHRIICLRLDS